MKERVQGYGKDELFLVITVYHQPKKGVRTERAGWGLLSSNWHDEEVPELVTRVSSNKLRSSAVIIDLKKDILVRNRFTKNDPADILAHFKKKYSQFIPNFGIKVGDIVSTMDGEHTTFVTGVGEETIEDSIQHDV
jgi:hypothetical protein